MLPKLNNSGHYQSSCIFVRNEKKIKKKKTKQNKTKGGKGREKKRTENWYISIMQPSRGVIVVAHFSTSSQSRNKPSHLFHYRNKIYA